MNETPEQQKYNQLLDSQIQNYKMQNDSMIRNEYNQSNMGNQQNMAQQQLDLRDILEEIKHFLSGHVLKITSKGEFWTEPEDDRMKIFSDYGVDQIMNVLYIYINKNTLLSNFDDEIIMGKVYDFGIALKDLIYNRYEYFFYYPKPEEIYEKVYPIVKQKGYDISEEELYLKCCKWSEEELAGKVRHYEMICIALTDAIHSAYRRSFRGLERDTIRKIFHVTENISPQQNQVYQPKKFSLFGRSQP